MFSIDISMILCTCDVCLYNFATEVNFGGNHFLHELYLWVVKKMQKAQQFQPTKYYFVPHMLYVDFKCYTVEHAAI